jgi:hypothetical protein
VGHADHVLELTKAWPTPPRTSCFARRIAAEAGRIGPTSAKIDRDTIYIMGKRVGALNYSPNGTLIADPAVTSMFGAVIDQRVAAQSRLLYTGSNDQIQSRVTWGRPGRI